MEIDGIPEKLLNHLAEHTGHGFVLFTTDTEGNMFCHSSFDSEIVRAGFMRSIEQWVEGINEREMEGHWNYTDENEELGEDF